MNRERTKSIYFTEQAYYYILKVMKKEKLTFNKAINKIIEKDLKSCE